MFLAKMFLSLLNFIHSRQRIFRCFLQCQINMNLVFHISEDGSETDKRPQRQALSHDENISYT